VKRTDAYQRTWLEDIGMKSEHRELWSKILAFDIDGGPAELSFAGSLARENGWFAAAAGPDGNL
jgi:hypothetical protein